MGRYVEGAAAGGATSGMDLSSPTGVKRPSRVMTLTLALPAVPEETPPRACARTSRKQLPETQW